MAYVTQNFHEINFNQLEIINNGDTYSDGNEGMGAHFKKNGPHTSKSDQNGLKQTKMDPFGGISNYM